MYTNRLTGLFSIDYLVNIEVNIVYIALMTTSQFCPNGWDTLKQCFFGFVPAPGTNPKKGFPDCKVGLFSWQTKRHQTSSIIHHTLLYCDLDVSVTDFHEGSI